jgi:hypothetical protein
MINNRIAGLLNEYLRPFLRQELDVTRSELQALKILIGRSLVHDVKTLGVVDDIQDAEFKVFSQFGDDGILQYLVHLTKPLPKTFIEFGVQDYSESNTRFLLMNDNWRGLIIDGDVKAMTALRSDELYWRHDLTAGGAFVTRENVNQLFRENGFFGEIGLLSIDIDGNDYWVWEAINSVDPVLVTVEYNSVFGCEHAITVPYDPAFFRTKAHFSNLFWGTSLKALCLLAERKGYAFVGSNSAGNNAHFVRKDKLGLIPALSAAQGYVESKFRESRDKNGNLTFLRGDQRIEILRDMQVYDVEGNRLISVKELFGLK